MIGGNLRGVARCRSMSKCSPLIDHRFGCRDLLWRDVIHRGTGKAPAVIGWRRKSSGDSKRSLKTTFGTVAHYEYHPGGTLLSSLKWGARGSPEQHAGNFYPRHARRSHPLEARRTDSQRHKVTSHAATCDAR